MVQGKARGIERFAPSAVGIWFFGIFIFREREWSKAISLGG